MKTFHFTAFIGESEPRFVAFHQLAETQENLNKIETREGNYLFGYATSFSEGWAFVAALGLVNTYLYGERAPQS